jgi:non-specific serine/threonine protein kinase
VAVSEIDEELAISELEQALSISEQVADLDTGLDILQSLAYFASSAGRHERATACCEEIIALTAPRGESMHRANALMTLGLDAWRRGDAVRAVELQRASLEIKLALDDRLGTALSLDALAWGVGASGQHKHAAHLLGAADALWESTGGSMAILTPELMRAHDNCVATARAALGDRVYATAFRHGTHMLPSQALHDAERERRSTRSGQVQSSGANPLTAREKQIAVLLAQGLSNKAIAKTLVIAQRTAETHVANILLKLGLTSRGQVAAWVAEHRGVDFHGS